MAGLKNKYDGEEHIMKEQKAWNKLSRKAWVVLICLLVCVASMV